MLGDRIKKARKIKKLTQKQLAELIGAKHSSVSDWENNLHRPDINTIPKICEALNVKGSWLLEEEETHKNGFDIGDYLTANVYDLPEEARKEIDNFIEFIKLKYKKD